MPITQKDKQQLDELHAQHGRTFGGKKEDYFALLYLTRKFKVEPEEIAHQVAFGNRDYGLDAYHIDRKAGNLYLYQFKWSESHALFRESMVRLAEAGLPRIFGNPTQDPLQNEFLRYLAQDLEECRGLIERVYVQFVFKGDRDAAEASEGLASRREDIENKQHLLEAYFGRDITIRVDVIADRPGFPPPAPVQTHAVQLRDAVVTTHGDRRLLVGFIRLIDLHDIYLTLRQRFFDRNIRAALSADNAPNKRIRGALADIVLHEKEEPDVFAFRHNGVTLAAERVSLDGATATLHVPRLLNGAQTVSSLARFLEDHEAHPGLRRGRERLERVQVLAKIVEADPASEFVVEVTIANNQQNPVQPWALRAMDRRQVDLADKFREDVGIFYSRQEGAFESLSDEEKQDLGIEDPKDVRIRPLAQTFLAAQGEIDKMSRLPDVFESTALYEATFKSAYSLPSTNTRSIVLAYKVGLVLNSPWEKLREVAPAKYDAPIRRAKSLLWALLVQALLNDPKLEHDRDQYGGSLAKERAFRERLQALTTSRVWPILREVFAAPTYQEKLQQEKFEFLRTKEVYKRAMDVAYTKWNWSRRPL
ncbi:AIPR family protein [Roseisolibacter agri]|uniref:Abortive phage infection protein C-terminal domain-containing protein n=1 Tax=Roseisolibacter agri TaxID=2014610 RepID=A0AA37Q725_9BACT|nr:AIPR family protein [Roseisolibacter agri]GLC27754.1 hypothetical protein rosag_42670 [Roseisolibacter agri]